VLVIFAQIYYFLKTLRPKNGGEKILQARGIVLIDELDAHLHPMWQQRIMAMLTGSFPNVQFVVSAHSPLIVAGCDRKEVAVMRRVSETDRFQVESLPQDFLGAKPEDLYKQIFEIEDMDRLYLEYSAKAAAGAQERVEEEISKILEKQRLTSGEEAHLDELRRERRLLLRANEVRQRRLEDKAAGARMERLENQIERLKDELRKRRGPTT
jgi:predicted ATP-binding protein involved in virulence